MQTALASYIPLNREWIHALIIHPFAEGAARINQAFQGIDFLSLTPRPLSFKERFISLITGLALMIPFINTIVWIAMQTWGHPDILADPYIPEEVDLERGVPAAAPQIRQIAGAVPPAPVNRAAPPPQLPPIQVAPAPQPQPPAPQAHQAAPAALDQARPLEIVEYHYLDQKGEKKETADWKIETFADYIDAAKQTETEFSTARYDRDGQIQEYHFRYQDDRGELHIRKEHNTLSVKGRTGNQNYEKSIDMPKNYPWIQQMTLGLKKFALSNKNKLDFYIINPKDLNLSHGILEKKGMENLPGIGSALKIEGRPGAWGLGWRKVADLWVDPQTGVLKKMSWQLMPWDAPTTTEWLRSGP